MDKRIKPCLKIYQTLRQMYQTSLDISSHNGINILETKHALIQAEHTHVYNSHYLFVHHALYLGTNNDGR
jgi:hypothetical protein